MENNKMITDNNSSWHLQMIAMDEEQQHRNQVPHFTDHHYHQNPLFNIPPPNYPLQDLQTTPAPPSDDEGEDDDDDELGPVKEMMYKMAAMQPVDIDPNAIRKPKRRNVRISDDPQSVAARRRRERISERIRILQRLVPGGAKMDTASMLDEAIRYVKFLRRQIRVLNKPANSFSDRESDYSFLLAPASSSSSDPSLPFDHYKLLASSDNYRFHGQRKSASPAGGGFFGF